jgi:hypothetical protein
LSAASNSLSALHAAATKPIFDSRFDYARGFIDFRIGPLTEVKRAAQVLNVSAMFHLHRNDAEAAHRDLLALVRLTQQKTEPLIIWQLVRQATTSIAINGVWQFLQHPAVTEEQLHGLQAALARGDLVEDMTAAYEIERALTMDMFRQLKASARLRNQTLARQDGWGGEFNAFVTHGWFLEKINAPLWRLAWADQDQLRTLERWQAAIMLERRARAKGWSALQNLPAGDPDDFILAALDWSSAREHSGFDRFRYLFSLGPFAADSGPVRRTLQTQTHKNMAFAALALRRFQLRHGELPETLHALVPELLSALPLDHMDNQPLRYRRVAKDEFLLYSVGENGTDEGGDSTPLRGSTYSQIWQGRDAVWPRAATSIEANEFMRDGGAGRGRR